MNTPLGRQPNSQPTGASGPRAAGAAPGNAGASNTFGVLVQRFRGLPPPAQIVIALVFVGFFYMIFLKPSPQPIADNPNLTTQGDLRNQQPAQNQQGVFTGLESDRPVLMQSWLEQNRREMADMKKTIEERFQQRDEALAGALQQNTEMQREMRQMMSDFTAEIRNMQESSQRDRDMLGQLAEEQKKIQLNGEVGGADPQLMRPREKINQTPLGSAGAVGGPGGNQAFLAPLANVAANGGVLMNVVPEPPKPLPFIPPLGFIHATMLNGVDALVGSRATPALVRLSGTYKTAMNSSVTLDGCYALIEFQGEISTERAVGKPSRMTCVYPDQGAMTYDISGYVVDAEDGIIGVPGIFYEGDATRIAAAMMADFAAGIAEVVEQNQSTTQTSVSPNGTSTNRTLTGDQAKAEIAGGAGKMAGSLRDYLFERVNRVVPFIRLDATRELNLVILSGTELRSEGSPWTLLFDAQAADQARTQRAQSTAAQVQNTPQTAAPVVQQGTNALLPPATLEGGQ